jgi:hypothetical protein
MMQTVDIQIFYDIIKLLLEYRLKCDEYVESIDHITRALSSSPEDAKRINRFLSNYSWKTYVQIYNSVNSHVF